MSDDLNWLSAREMARRFAKGDLSPVDALEATLAQLHKRNVVVMPEQVDDGLCFVKPQHAVIDEHAGEPVADRFVGPDRGDGRNRRRAIGCRSSRLGVLLDRLLRHKGNLTGTSAFSCEAEENA